MIVDDALEIALIDNSGIRSRQQVGFGELPYRPKIRLSSQARNKNWPATFPFHKPKFFDHPTIDDLYAYLVNVVDPKSWQSFAKHYGEPKKDGKPRDLTSNVVIWQDDVWIQAIGDENYGPIVPEVISQKLLDKYAALTFQQLRADLSPTVFSDIWIREALGRRDQILKAARNIRRGP